MPSKPEGRYSLVEADRSVQSDAATVKSFHGQSISVPVVVITTCITAAASVIGTYFATRGSSAPADCATRESVIALDSKLEQLNTRFTGLAEKVLADASQQHNDLVDLKLKMVEQGRSK